MMGYLFTYKYNTMRLNDLIISDNTADGLHCIKEQCEHFFEQAGSSPLFKNLPASYADVQKVKIRKRKQHAKMDSTFNLAFEREHYDIRQRAMFANGVKSLIESTEDTEPFFVFPIDGYQYIYCPDVQNSSDEYKQVFGMMYETFGEKKGNDVAVDMLRFTYKQNKLMEGIDIGAEIIIYDIPYYYAARQSMFNSYDDILDLVNET